MKDVIVLGIETSCDETSAAVVKNGRQVLSNTISSQVDLHQKFGGVVPEIASRKHVELIMPVISQSLEEAGIFKQQNLNPLCPSCLSADHQCRFQEQISQTIRNFT